MKKDKIVLMIIIIFIMIFGGIAYWILNDITTKESTWQTKYIEGSIKELKLITTFPDEGCLVVFKDGNYSFINDNYMWAYAHLSVIDSWNAVNITYKVNGMGQTKAINIREIRGLE